MSCSGGGGYGSCRDGRDSDLCAGCDAATKKIVQKIGVYDDVSLITCLVANYESVFPGFPSTDPQDMIQRLTAEIMNLRRQQNLGVFLGCGRVSGL